MTVPSAYIMYHYIYCETQIETLTPEEDALFRKHSNTFHRGGGASNGSRFLDIMYFKLRADCMSSQQ